ncbi:MAG: CIA30 family protein [Verrucomicrobiota bacterium]
MKTTRPFALALIFTGTSLLTVPQIASAEKSETPWNWRGQTIAEFDEGEYKGPEWSIVNDGVMGGLSKGKAQISKDGILTFSGTLSLENNGGFTLVETADIERDLSNDLGILLLVKGDGRKYQVRLESDARYRNSPVSFAGEFETKKGQWHQVKVPFESLRGGWRGRDLPDEVFNPATVQRVGIILADKQEGPFELQVDWIRTYGKGQGKPLQTSTEEKPKEATGPKSLIATAVADGRFTTLKAALDAAKLTTFFQWDNKLTVFAPTDEAFAKLPEGTLENLLKPESKDRLVQILSYHVHPGSLSLVEALEKGEVATIEKSPLPVLFAEGRSQVGSATLLEADIECADGTIHVIDTVLIPEPKEKTLLSTASEAGVFTTLLAAAKAAGLYAALEGKDNLTVLAPTDEAFAALPEGTVEQLLKEESRKALIELLTTHIVSGSVSAGDALNLGKAKSLSGKELTFGVQDGLFNVNGSTIDQIDIDGGNGTIHILGSVIGFGKIDDDTPEASFPKTSSTNEKSESDTTASISDLNATELIVAAIRRGVPLYNSGHILESANVYEQCLRSLSENERLDEKTRGTLSRVADAGKAKDPDSRAWFYRHALDRMIEMLSARS